MPSDDGDGARSDRGDGARVALLAGANALDELPVPARRRTPGRHRGDGPGGAVSAAQRALRSCLARLPSPPRAARSRPRRRAVTTSSRCCSSATLAWGSRACCCASRCAACRPARPALCLRHAAPPPARRPGARVRPAQESKYEEDYLSTIGVDFVRGAPPLAPLRRPAAALALSVACWLVRRSENPDRGDRRQEGQVPAGARARTTTARAAASAGPLASARSRLPPAAARCSGTLPGRSASGRSRAATTAGARAS